jgi:hypothetical protein
MLQEAVLAGPSVRLALKFSAGTDKAVVDFVANSLSKLNVERPSTEDPVIIVKAPRELLIAKCDQLRLLKHNMEGKLAEFTVEAATEFPNPLFCSAQEAFLLTEIVTSITCGQAVNKFIPKDAQQALSEDELIHTLLCHGILESITPLHDTHTKIAVWNAVKLSTLSTSNVNLIREYYGSEVALYFAWMDHFTTWLCIPGFFGLGLAIYHYVDYFTPDLSIDNSPFAPLFGLLVTLWGALFCQFWKQRCTTLACYWGTLDEEEEEHVRPEFYGTLTGW